MRATISALVAASVFATFGCNTPSSTAAVDVPAKPSAASMPSTGPTPPPSAAAPTPKPVGSVAKIPADKVSAPGKAVADKIAKSFTDGLKSGKFSDTADFADDLKVVTPVQWKSVFDATNAKYGDYKSMTFADAWDDEKGGTMYRYKASFAKADKVEFRVDLNGQNKSTKFGTYDWLDTTP